MRALLTTLSLLAFTSAVASADSHISAKVLIITGDHKDDWKETTPVLEQILTNAGHEVVVTQTPRLDLTPAKLAAYDVFLLNYADTEAGSTVNPNSVWTDGNKQAFANAVEAGTGLVVLHYSSAAFTEGSDWSKTFEQITAGGWRKQGLHGETHEFTLTVQRDHPITRGVKSFKHTRDELYQNSLITPGSEVLVTAFNGIEQDEPMLWVNSYGKGRVVQYTLGHDPTAMSGDGFRTLLGRSVKWAGEKGFRMLFDGKTLAGWEGNSLYWSVENGAIVGQGPSWQAMSFHDFLCSVEEFADFELRLEAKVIGQRNSGVTVRTRRQPLRTTQIVMGYEIDMGMQRWGWVYEEGGTRRLLNPEVQAELQPKVQKVLRHGEFNDFVIRAEGNRITSWINGVEFEYVDTDEKLAQEMRKGTIGFQLHFGPPQVVSFRNIRIKELP